MACCTLRGWSQIENTLAGDAVGLSPHLIIDDVYGVTLRTGPSPPFQHATLKGQEKGLGTRLSNGVFKISSVSDMLIHIQTLVQIQFV